ncbi:putative external nadh-ubiquinone oxidoreductase mitochondrial precursor protein [Botrytis fragariae]|uniref:Putative external nadh-ubiquinone oxidoreductase mitochondrial protein n=1 Tax=Botrytis fragariae TaxID=1964551 RepID=A0A8H6ENL0_9HELO|nr:putative external nadh-ubiquinone oxidoreductase mitochondrial precursor protein [Botrytis fragariae]KAF5878971.1 putative external nadh-ubiquinone oxidoreductase mitochondrial precursor protein [Botrytis fragariae]
MMSYSLATSRNRGSALYAGGLLKIVSSSKCGKVAGLSAGARCISTRELDASKGDRERVLILGSGWSGFTLSRQLDPKKYQTVVISPRSYFVFTPLLASTAVGTLEFRSALESVRGRGRWRGWGLVGGGWGGWGARGNGVEFWQGWADDVNFDKKTIKVEENAIERPKTASTTIEKKGKGKVFEVDYDKLVVSVGCYSQTFGIEGVRENALFLKDVGDARKIRKRILECFETAALPTSSDSLRKQLLNFAIVGGGPTGVEFAAELFDLCHEDLSTLYPSLTPFIKITIYDVAPKILPMFDKNLANYALEHFKRDGIEIKTEHHILGLRRGLPKEGENGEDAGKGFTLNLKEEGDVGVGMCVWSTGLMMNPFIEKALSSVHTFPTQSAILSGSDSEKSMERPEDKKWELKRSPKTGGLMVDNFFRVKLATRSSPDGAKQTQQEATMNDVFALGDVAVLGDMGLPATAQVANQEARWLGKRLNKMDKAGKIGAAEDKGFTFRNMGVMTYVGGMKAIMQTDGKGEIKGRTAWVIWRGAYLTQTISWRNKILIPMYWAINWLFGRDISRF